MVNHQSISKDTSPSVIWSAVERFPLDLNLSSTLISVPSMEDFPETSSKTQVLKSSLTLSGPWCEVQHLTFGSFWESVLGMTMLGIINFHRGNHYVGIGIASHQRHICGHQIQGTEKEERVEKTGINVIIHSYRAAKSRLLLFVINY